MLTEPRAHDLSAPLHRQRRNLMIVSLTLLFVHFSGATVGSASALGLQISFSKPEVLLVFLWLFLFYYLARYFQYLLQEPDLPIENDFYDHLRALSWPKITACKNAAFPGMEQYGGEFDFRKMRRVDFWTREVMAIARTDGGGGFESDTFRIDVRHFSLEIVYSAAHVVFRRSYFSDYFLPVLLAGSAAMVSGPTLVRILLESK